MIRKGIKLRSKLFMYIAGFAALILMSLWLFQIIFLNDFYKYKKTNQIKETANIIVKEIDNNNLKEYLDEVSSVSNFCVRIYDLEGRYYYQNTNNKETCGLRWTSNKEVEQLFADAKKNDGEIIKETDGNIIQENTMVQGESPFQVVSENFKSITLGRVVKSAKERTYFVLIDSRITPMNETTDILIEQFKIIAFALIGLTALLASFISWRISKPIRSTNENAKRLAKGDLEICFQGKGYIEIEELNKTLNYAIEELKKVESFRNELIANMSHDLRTPLTMIGGYAEVMRDLPNETTKENIQVIIDETRRLTNLVNNILDLSKIQSKTETLQISTFSITDTIEMIAKRFEVMLENDNYNIIIEKNRNIIVRADEMKINQVVYNILGNAIHFAGVDKKIVIRQITIKNKVRIEIEDSGRGIKKEDIPYVWDRYYKLKNNHKRQDAGTGIGLSIVKGILEMHHVTFGVTSEQEKGALFYFELPIFESNK